MTTILFLVRLALSVLIDTRTLEIQILNFLTERKG